MRYEHVQYGYWGAGTVVLMMIVGVFTLPETFAESTVAGWVVTATLVLIAGITVWFSRLVVTIDNTTLSASFGPGWPRKNVNLSEVATASAVRNAWIQGWGLRKLPGGWMYNTWGLDAIELEMTSDRIVRIGTNDTDNLLASVRVLTG